MAVLLERDAMTIDDQLAALWAAGASFTDMALKLGETRNANCWPN